MCPFFFCILGVVRSETGTISSAGRGNRISCATGGTRNKQKSPLPRHIIRDYHTSRQVLSRSFCHRFSGDAG